MFKKISYLLTVMAFVGWTASAIAFPVSYDITFLANSGTGGSGVFTLDSSSLAAIPASGSYFSPPNLVLSFNAVVAGILFDTVGSSGIFTAINGQIVGICCTDFSSSVVPGALFQTNTAFGVPSGWQVDDATGATIASGDTYSVSASNVPVPATMALLGLGLAGLSWSRRRYL